VIILGGRVFGRGFGFVLGAITLFAGALLTGGVGPWLPFQMLAMGWFCMGAGLLPGPARLRGRGELWLLAVYGALSAELYGLVMDLQGWPYIAGLGNGVSFVPGAPLRTNLVRFLAYHFSTAMAWDISRSTLTAVLCLSLGRPLLHALRRASRRAAFDAPAAFVPPPRPAPPDAAPDPTPPGP